jgi:hypothetical protein
MVVGHVMRCFIVDVITIMITMIAIIITVCDDGGSWRAAVQGLGFSYRV